MSLPSLTKLPVRPVDALDDYLDDLPAPLLELIAESLAKMSCDNTQYPALYRTSKTFEKIYRNEALWEQKCKEEKWTTGVYRRPSPMRSWFAHYMIHYCGPYAPSVSRMLRHAALEGDVKRVAAALASGADPTRTSEPLLNAVSPDDENKGGMVGIVKLLLQYGPPPASAMREALVATLVHQRFDPGRPGEDQQRQEYRRLYNESIAKPSLTVASILLDYIDAKQYLLGPTSWGSSYNLMFFQDLVRRMIRRDYFDSQRMRLLVEKRPFLAIADYRKDLDNAFIDPDYDIVPYNLAISGVGMNPATRSHIVETLIDLKFPTTLPETQDSTLRRYATVLAAIEGDCNVLDLLLEKGAEFPKLNKEEQKNLLIAIDDRRQEKDEGDGEGEPCDMALHLRTKGYIVL